MTFRRFQHIPMPDKGHSISDNALYILRAFLLCGVVMIVLSQLLQVSKAQVLYMPASEYGNANLNYTPEVYNPENVFDAFAVFEPLLELINARQHDARLSAPIGRLNLFLRRVDGAEGTSFCTASLISDRHILTNYHCIPGIDKNIRVERATLRLGYLSERDQGQEFKVKMQAIESDAELDYSIFELADIPGSRYGVINLANVRDPKPLENLFIIHHPGGKPKYITRERCYMHPSWDLVSSSEIFHKCDTQAGSSGAIIFSDTNQPVGMHWGGYDESQPLSERYNVAKKLTKIIERSPMIKQLTGVTAQPTVPSGNGLLRLSSSPVGAEVYLNGEYIGNTPVEASVPEGNYQANLKLRGHEEFKANVVMRRDTETSGTLALKAKQNDYIYSVAASQHKPQALIMPEMLQDILVDPYAAYATPPPPSIPAIAAPISVGVSQGVSVGVSQTPTTGTNTASGITMVAGARPVAGSAVVSNPVVSNPVASSPVVSNPVASSNYLPASTTTTNGGPTAAFVNAAAINPNLTSTIYAQTPVNQTLPDPTTVDIDPINPTQAGDDTAGLNDMNSGIGGVYPQGAKWDVVGRGESANMEHMGFVIVHDASTLFKVWARAYGNVSVVPTLPSIDFARESVVGVFLGIQPAVGLNLQVNNVLLKSQAAHVYVSIPRPDDNIVSQGFVSPWILVRVPKNRVGTVLFYDNETASLLGIAKKQ